MIGIGLMASPWLIGLAGDSMVIALDVGFGLVIVLYAVWLSYRESSPLKR